jgi:hypothetical protein
MTPSGVFDEVFREKNGLESISIPHRQSIPDEKPDLAEQEKTSMATLGSGMNRSRWFVCVSNCDTR